MPPLDGKTIVITRRREQAGELHDLLRAQGAAVVFLPTIQVVPPASWDACDAALDRLESYQLLVFASVNAVTMFLHRCVAKEVEPERLARCEIAVVGRRTGEELERLKLRPQHLPEEATAAALVAYAGTLGVKNRRVLVPHGDLARTELCNGLRGLGALVDEVVVYRTIAPEAEASAEAVGVIRDGRADVLTFASPSAVRNFCALLGWEDLRNASAATVIAAIGPTTAEAVRDAGGSRLIVAREPSARGLVGVIIEYYNRKS